MTDSERALVVAADVENNYLVCSSIDKNQLEKYIVDFYAPKASLVVELDGFQHKQTGNPMRDKGRDSYL